MFVVDCSIKHITMKQFKASDLRREIKKEYGGIPALKKHLKSIATNPYGCFTSEVTVYGCRISYTSNPNCFATYLVSIPMVGMSNSMALDKQSLTKAGILRGCANYHL